MRLCRLIVLMILALTGTSRAAWMAPLPRSISTSRQFIVYGTDVPLRGAVSELGERSKASLLRLLGKRDDWKTPIIVNLQFPQANLPETPPAQLYVSQTGFGLKIQLDLTVAADFNAASLRRELLRALLLEMIYRNHSDLAPGTAYARVPDWLLDAMTAQDSQEQEALAEALNSAAESDKLLSLDQFLQQKPERLDSGARLLYRAYSLALLQFLLEQGGGAPRLIAYIESLARTSNDPWGDLKANYALLADSPDLAAKWKGAVKTLGSAASYRLLSFAETQRQLEDLLHTALPGTDKGKTSTLEELGTAKPSRGQIAMLNRLSQDLLLLSTRANPVLRPIVLDYQTITQRLASGKKAGLTARLATLKRKRAEMGGRMNEIDDYMNWFEATQMTTKSGVFKDYLKAAREPSAPERRRRDALSVYLDAVEAQFRK